MSAPEFPMFAKIEFRDDGSAKSAFIRAMGDMASTGRARFDDAFGDIGATLTRSLASFKGGALNFDLGVGNLRQTAAEADHALQRLVAMRDAAIALAGSTGDTSAATKSYLDALRAQVIEADQAKQAADAQAATYAKLQGEIDRTIGRNEALAASYRETFAEQARQVNGAYRAQREINGQVSPALAGSRAIDNGASFSALDAAARAEEAAAAAMARHAAAAAELRAALDPALTAQQRFDAELARADDLLAAGAISAREYASAQALARDNLQSSWAAITRTSAAQEGAAKSSAGAAASARAQRFAFQQLGQQMQDATVQLQMGTSALTVFSQQAPQAAFALSGLTDSNSKLLRGVGATASFLSGPWGAAIFAATAVLGPYVVELFRTRDALDDVGDAADEAMKKLYASLNQASAFSDAMTEVAKKRITAMAGLAQVNRQITEAEANFSTLSRTFGGAEAAIGAQDQLSGLYAQRDKLKADLKDSQSQLGQIQSALAARKMQTAADERLNTRPERGSKGDRKPGGGASRKGASEAEKDARELERQADAVRDIITAQERELAIGGLILQGREAEADALQLQFRVMDALGVKQAGQLAAAMRKAGITAQEAERLERNVTLQQKLADETKRAQEAQAAYLDTTQSLRSEMEAILSGQGKVSNLKNTFKQLQGKLLTNAIFGDAFADLDAWVKQNTPLGKATDQFTSATEQASTSAIALATAFDNAATRVSALPAAGSTTGGDALSSIADKLAAATGANDNQAAREEGYRNHGDIIAAARKRDAAAGLSYLQFTEQASGVLAERVTGALDKAFDVNFFGQFKNVMAGGMYGYAVGGEPGAALGVLKGIKGLPDAADKLLGVSKAFDKAIGGAATGTAVAGIAGAFGVNLSNSGSQIGGALGSMIPIPGGDIIGAIAGGIIGKLAASTKRGSATIGGMNGSLGITGTRGNSGSFIEASSTAADSIIGNVGRIADAFGATVNAALGSVSIGIRDGKYRVDASGQGITKTRNGAIDFGKDGAQAAAMYATMDLIKDGVIKGLRTGTQKLLQNAKDLETGLAKALDFEGVFQRLKAIDDPVGAALDTLDKEFSRLKLIAEEAGEGMVEVERLYGIERAKVVKEANLQVIGSLKDLYDRLTIGDSGLSLRARQEAATAAYTPLAARVRAGDTTAYDDFAKASDTLITIARELYGSQKGYFDIFNEVTALSKNAIDAQQAIADAAINRDSPFSQSAAPATDNAAVVDAIANQTDALIDALAPRLDAVNDNLGSMIAQAIANGSAGSGPNFNFANYY